MTENVLVSFACNDPKSGRFTGRFDAFELEVDGDRICLISFGDGISIKHSDHQLRVGHLRITYTHFTEWLGNWCWDGFHISNENAARILNYLRKHGFDAEDASGRFCDLWDAKKEIAASDLEV